MGVEPIGLNRLGTDYPALNREILVKTVSPYLSAEALGLKEEHRQALIGLAGDLAHERIPDEDWGMGSWETCICGHLRKRTGVSDKNEFGGKITPLFLSGCGVTSQSQAGQATYNYLTIAEPRWNEVTKAKEIA
jgi:hypothetical protein